MMNSIRKWLYKPKKTDSALLAQFYFADEELNAVAAELDSFDSRKDPERCTALVTQLRGCQDKVLNIIHRMMNEAIPYSRTSRDFRVKFPDDVVQENLAGQLWFGAECLAAGSSIMNREMESASMRPLARALTKNLDSLRCILREQSLTNVIEYTERIQEALTIFDKLFADFELRYVSAMVPVKSVKEYETIQEITVLFSETVIRAKKLGYITTDMIDEYDPALMFTIPRLAIVCGLLIYSDGPLNPDSQSWNMSDMFRPFQTLLYKIRELLYTLSEAELLTLERALCSQEEPEFLASSTSGVASTAAATSTSETGVQTDELPSKVCADSEDAQSLDSSEKSLEACREVDLLPPHGDGDRYVSSSDSLGGGSVSPGSDASESCRDGCCHCTADRPPEVEASGRPRSLNKCDSSDSGLHSEVISNSDSLHTMSSSNSHQLLSHSTMSSPPLSPFDDEQSNLVTGEESHFPLGHVEEKDFTADDQCNLVRTFLETASGMSPGDSAEHLTPHLTSPVNAACRLGESSVAREKVEEDEEESFYSASPGESPLHVSRLPRISSAHPAAPSEGYLHTQVTNEKVLQTNDAEFPNTYCDFCPSQDCCDNVSGQHAFTVSRSCLPAYERQEVDNGDRINRSEEECTFSDCLVSSDQDKMQGAHVANVNFDMAVCSDHGNKSQGDREEDSSQELDTPFQNAPMLWTSGESNGLEDNSVHGGIFLHLKETDDGEVKVNGEEVGPTCRCGCNIVEEFGRDSSVSVHGSVPCPYEARENCEVEMTGVSEGPEAEQVVGDSCSQGQCDRCTQTPQSAINNSQSSKILHHHHHHHYHHHHHHHHSLLQQCPSPVPDTGCSAEFHASCHKCDRIKANTKESSNSKLNKLPPDQSTGRHSEQSEVSATTIKISSKSSCNHGKTVTVRQSGMKKDFATVDPSLSSRQCADSSSNCSSSSEGDTRGWSTEGGVHERQGDPPSPEAASASSGCEPTSSASDCEWEGDSCSSSETSSYNSECHDDEEIALAVQAAELASRNQARARFRSSSDMIHRLFVCISGVADQLQTNFAGDLRNILRVVFNLHCSEPVVMEEEKFFTRRRRGSTFRQGFNTGIPQNQGFRGIREPPPWIPDDQSTMCMSCKTPFTFVRRRHHCRNCGKIFCGRCSSNAVSLPHFGHSKPVRVCNRCFMFQVTPFTMQAQ